MIAFLQDDEVKTREPVRDIEKLAGLLSLLCGQRIRTADLSEEARDAINLILQRAEKEDVRLSFEEFNELLLLFNQYRVSRQFFDYFFVQKNPDALEPNSIAFSKLSDGITRFRGFAMLCFGNFRFAFRRLSRETDYHTLTRLLAPWNRNSEIERCDLANRQSPLTPLVNTADQIAKDNTWLLGYISAGLLKADAKALQDKQQQLNAASESGGELDASTVALIRRLTDEITALNTATTAAQAQGKRNTTKYLTWDFLDVYVATSMRQRWEFEETHSFIEQVFLKELRDLPQVRWFDPTQAYSDSIPDKGLVEALMLKRAKCTIYMAQEGDTLGKDSELAATLAQGKPVVAYVPQYQGQELKALPAGLEKRPIGYFRQRLLTLLADGFFDRPDNREAVSRLSNELGLVISADEMLQKVNDLLRRIMPFENQRAFKLVGSEELEFKNTNNAFMAEASKLMAAIESRAADNRAETIRTRHPLSMQVHLETGVANGVLVARNATECAHLVRGILTCDLAFKIGILAENGKDIAQILVEDKTNSRFRIITRDSCLTNSFWNFYIEQNQR